jgi:hypothetical protein
MRPALAEIKTLEDFISGTLPEENRQEVEIRLLWDQDFQQQAALQKLAYRALREAGREQLRRELKAIHVSLFSA